MKIDKVTFLKNTFILTGVMLAVWALFSGVASGILAVVAPESQSPEFLLIFFAIVLVNVLVYEWYILRSNAHGRRLTLVLFFLIFGVIFFMPQIETLYFNDAIQIPVAFVIALIGGGVVVAGVVSLLAVRLSKKRELGSSAVSAPPLWEGSTFELAWKLTALALTYLIFYLLAGYFIAWQVPELRAFYSGSTEILGFFEHYAITFTADPLLPLFQVLRGFLWAGLALIATRTLDPHRKWENPIIVGLLLSIGLSLQILLPNPYLPAAVRYGHLPELLIENFLFGVIAAILLASSRLKSPVEAG